jgi:hypothetical protein
VFQDPPKRDNLGDEPKIKSKDTKNRVAKEMVLAERIHLIDSTPMPRNQS